ncbi:MAG: hypothetical protein K6T83_13895 [Alicyclobacillus sp.]|nr:hypothetical protein [Alicyclobacillus sp.]
MALTISVTSKNRSQMWVREVVSPMVAFGVLAFTTNSDWHARWVSFVEFLVAYWAFGILWSLGWRLFMRVKGRGVSSGNIPGDISRRYLLVYLIISFVLVSLLYFGFRYFAW